MKKTIRILFSLFMAGILFSGFSGCSSESSSNNMALAIALKPVPLKDISLDTFLESINRSGTDVPSYEFSLNNSYKIKPDFTPKNATNKGFVLSVSNADDSDENEYLSVSGSNITASKETGSTSVKLTVTSKANRELTKTYTVKVISVPLQSLSFDCESAELGIGKTLKKVPVFNPADASDKSLVWSSSDDAIATVDDFGTVTGVGEGDAEIRATNESTGLLANYGVNVKPIMPTRLTLKRTSFFAQAGGSVNLVPVFTPSDTTNKNVTYSCTTEGVDVDENGIVTIGSSVTTSSIVVTVTSVADPTKTARATISRISAGEWIINENDTKRGYLSAVTGDGQVPEVKTNNLDAGSWLGGGYLDSLGTGSVSYAITSGGEQDAKVYLRYAYWGAKGAARVAQLIVNGVPCEELLYCNWTNKALGNTNEITVHLIAGENQIRLISVPKDTVCHIKTGSEAGIVYPSGYTPGTNDGYGNYGDGKADGNLPNLDYIAFKSGGYGFGTASNSNSYYMISVESDAESRGSVQRSPDSGIYTGGSSITITAVPEAGFAFDSWCGDICSTTNPLTFKVDSDKTVYAHFIPAGYSNSGLEGYAGISDDKGTKYTVCGGAGGTEITISSLTDLNNNKSIIAGNEPYIIRVAARISTTDNKSLDFTIGSNKTLIGTAGSDYGFKNINPKVAGKNVIIKNLHFGDVIGDDFYKGSGNDALSIKGGEHVWIDHCEFSSSLEPRNNDGTLITLAAYKAAGGSVDLEGESNEEIKWKKDFYDGLLDVSEMSRFVSVSNSYFHDHWKACLCGGSNDEASQQLKGKDVRLTFYNNYFKNIHARQPLFRFGKAHIYSSYFEGVADGSSTGIEVRAESQVYVDNCAFVNFKPEKTVGYWNTSKGLGAGTFTSKNNSGAQNSTGTSYVPPYGWTKTSAATAKTNAGNK